MFIEILKQLPNPKLQKHMLNKSERASRGTSNGYSAKLNDHMGTGTDLTWQMAFLKMAPFFSKISSATPSWKFATSTLNFPKKATSLRVYLPIKPFLSF
jgi:hypothetical protein